MEKQEIVTQYREKRGEIDGRLEDFERLKKASDRRLFKELVFVIFTSQTSAKRAWEATEKLADLDLISKGSKEEIADVLAKLDVQYEKDKAAYVVENREKLSQPTLADTTRGLKLSQRIDPENLEKTREQLVGDIKGLGWKGASHFLRNIGYGNGFAIISSYIVQDLVKLGLKEEPEPPKNKEEYLEDERKLQELAEELNIDIKALDLVLWSMETGEVFK